MPKEDVQEKLLEMMAALRQKGTIQIPRDKAFDVITQYFGNDRNKRNYTMDMLVRMGYFKQTNGLVLEVNHEIEEKYRKDKTFFV